jgi:hypothetical protein
MLFDARQHARVVARPRGHVRDRPGQVRDQALGDG